MARNLSARGMCLLICGFMCMRSTQAQRLHFDTSGTFSIIQFTDLHLGDTDDKDSQTLKALRQLLVLEPNIDLAVFSGDIFSGFFAVPEAPQPNSLNTGSKAVENAESGDNGGSKSTEAWYKRLWAPMAEMLREAGKCTLHRFTITNSVLIPANSAILPFSPRH